MTTRPRIYAAHPMTCYRTEHERAFLDTLAGLLLGAEIIDPATRYRTTAGWLRAWPRLVSTLSGLVVFADEHGTIGTGCMREVTDAIAAGVPVACLDRRFGLCELAGLDLLPDVMRTRSCAAWPVAGEPVGPGFLTAAAVPIVGRWPDQARRRTQVHSAPLGCLQQPSSGGYSGTGA